MGLYIKGMSKAKHCIDCPLMMCDADGDWCALQDAETNEGFKSWDDMRKHCPLVEVKSPHGRLIDADALRASMYHEAFDTDTPMQKWENGCWIRYKMFERIEEAAPTMLEAEGKDDD